MRRLRTRFVVAAMIAVSVVLFALVGTMNVVNYLGVCESADERLTLISQGGLSIPASRLRHLPKEWRRALRRGSRPPRARGATRNPSTR